MLRAFTFTLIVVIGILMTAPALAGARDDCITKCKEAALYVQTRGLEAAIKEIGNKNGKFVWNKGINYVFMMDMDARMIAHPMAPELTKVKNLIETRDVNGKQFNVDIINAAKKGKGWTNYVWMVPGLGVEKPKHTFIYRVPNTNYLVGAGFYVIEAGVYR